MVKNVWITENKERIITYNTKYVIIGIILFVVVFYHINNAHTELIDRIVAVVNDEIISLYELNQVVKPYKEKIKTLGYTKEQEENMLYKIKEDKLNILIEKKLIDQEVRRLSISISNKEIDEVIEKFKELNLLTDENLRAALKENDMSMEEYRNQIKAQILRNRLLNYQVKSKVVITNEAIKSYYEKNIEQYAGEKKYHLRNIMMNVSDFASDLEKKEVLKRMEKVLEKIKEGESFEELASEYSQAPNADKGGMLGILGVDSFAPEIKDAILGLKVGESTSVVRTDHGFQIFYIEDIETTKGKTLDEVASEIEERLYNKVIEEKFRNWTGQFKQKSYIKIIN
mmetsp:Transcript_13795/g.6848  ORF Transcript_13795/g.6848 Transcript_13795/m.6848 type:complete len:342 (+) Transcript_13795:1119-2144(+)